MKNKNRVFVLGLDGASFNILDPLMKRGIMPNLLRITSKGVRANLKSTYPPLTPTAWSSFMTGMNPGKHGVYSWLKTITGEYDRRPVDTAEFYNDTLWKYLSDNGKKVGVLNVPMTYPPRELNGFIISGMDTPLDTKCSFPEELYSELVNEIGDYKIEVDWTKYTNKSRAEFLKDLFYCTKKRHEATLHLIERDEWDFFMVVFVGLDRIQHFLWKSIESVLEGKEDGEIEREVSKYYNYIDTIIGDIVERLGSDTTLIMMSDHGFKPLHKSVQWNRWLNQNGYLFIKEGKKKLLNKIIPIFHSLGINRKSVKSLLRFINIDNQRISNKLDSYSIDFGTVDWDKTKAYNAQPSGIRINLKGREPSGAVSPGDEYDKLVSDLIENIKSFTDPETGARIVENVYRADEVYKGKYLAQAPDIVIDYGSYPYESFTTSVEATEELSIPTDDRKGVHDPDGIFVGHGKVFNSEVDIGPLDIIDIFPTILYLMGLPIPPDVDGRIAHEIIYNLNETKLRKENVTLQKENNEVDNDIKSRSPEEDKIIKDRLRGLGYID